MSTIANITASIQQPPWIPPPSPDVRPILKLYNSLTRSKVEFNPNAASQSGGNPNLVSWYCCGPTVYDKSHLGHARAYITFDILRRIMGTYFGYTIDYVMNITDIDDKIITGARYAHLYHQYAVSAPSIEHVRSEVQAAISFYKKKRFCAYLAGGNSDDEGVWTNFAQSAVKGTVDKQGNEKFDLYFKTITRAITFLAEMQPDFIANVESLEPVKDVLSAYLDSKLGHTVTDQTVFRDFSRFWEGEFFKDTDALNILRPTVLTRVSEFVPEVVAYVAKIISNGYAYEEDGSVYFNTTSFKKCHHYAKLEPWSASNSKLLAEGEGDLCQSKRDSDFVLWKKSKIGEPSWPSPWGPGRPGWHIECSVMACHVFGEKLDIHSGGIDLAFPHHDNEIAQVEAHYNSDQWVNYFLHAGHLHISGMKMSKSLKNFITIQDALKESSACTLRIMFLLHPWNSLLDYGASSMSEAKSLEQSFKNFLAMTRALVEEEKREQELALSKKLSYMLLAQSTSSSGVENSSESPLAGSHNFNAREKALSELIVSKDAEIHACICDSFNTPAVMQHLKDLMSAGNSYYNESLQSKLPVNTGVLVRISDYLIKWMDIFGVPWMDKTSAAGTAVNPASGDDRDFQVLPVARVLAEFRDAVKDLSIKRSPHADFLALCDRVRDVDCVDLGIMLSDRGGGGKALVKLMDPVALKAQAAQEAKAREAKQEAVRRLNEAKEAKRREVEARWAIVPDQYFRTPIAAGGGNDVDGADAFVEWDAEGLPTQSKKEGPVTKSRRKKMEKELSLQKRYHQLFLDGKPAS